MYAGVFLENSLTAVLSSLYQMSSGLKISCDCNWDNMQQADRSLSWPICV